MDRRAFLKASGAAVTSLATAGCGPGTDPPNIILCFTDQFRPFEIGCYGNSVIQTPHIDKMAEGGFRFDVGVTNSPVCTPARANLLSGQYARTSAGSIRNVGSISPTRTRYPDPTLPEVMKQSGYRTGHVGKWHVHVDPFLLGFDYAYYPVEIPHRYYGREMREASRDGDKLTTDVGEQQVVAGFLPQNASDKALDYIRKHKDEPFFLNYSVSFPHMPIGPGNLPDKFNGLYNRDEVPLRNNVFQDGQMSRDEWWFKVYTKWDYYWRTRGGGGGELPGDELPEGFDLRDLTAYYYDAVTCTDDLIGQLMTALEENGIAGNTIVVLSSDHGELLGNHHAYNKDRLWEEAIRVPMIYHYPSGWGRGETAAQVASNIDIMPTVLAAAGLEIPNYVQGQNLLPVLRGEGDSLNRDYSIIEVAGYPGISYVDPHSVMTIRTPTYKYGIELEEDDRGIHNDRAHFYDLRNDPYELTNLASTDQQAGLAAHLRETLVKWHRSTPWLEVTDDLPHL